MKNFLHGLGGGVGRGIGRTIGFIIVVILILFIINILHLDIKSEILNKILFLDVHAATTTTNLTNSIQVPTNSDCDATTTRGRYCAITTAYVPYVRSVNTTYSGVLSRIEFQFSNAWTLNELATLTLTAMSTDFRNNSLSVVVYDPNGNTISSSFSFVSKKTINIYFIPTIALGNYVIDISSPTALTGIDTYGLKSVVVKQSTNDNSDIINNNNENTQDIINNNNENTQEVINNIVSGVLSVVNGNNDNTQDIIDNNNDNTQDIIDNQNDNTQKELENATCPVGPAVFDKSFMEGNGYISSNGSIVTGGNSFYSVLYKVRPNQTYYFDFGAGASSNYYACFYTASMSSPKCVNLISSNSNVAITNGNRPYLRFTLRNSSDLFGIKGPVCNDWEKEAQDYANKKLGDTFDLIGDDNIDSGLGSDFFNDFNDETFGLSDIVTLPLTTIQSLTSTTCVALEVPIPFTNTNISLPCMKNIYQNKFGSIYSIWRYVSYGLIAYWIATDIFKMVKGFKDPEQDKVEVLDL